MHIYIRTGDNENTGIEFLNGKGWSEPHIEQNGFIFTPKNAPARRYEFKDSEILKRNRHENWGIRSEKHLAAIVLLSEELSTIPETESVESITWVSVGRLGISSCDLMLYNELENLKGATADSLRDEIQHIIYRYLNEGPTHVEVSVTDEDRKRITYDSTERDNFGCLRKDKPQGFSVKFDDKVLHYSVPEFLRHAAFSLTDEQETLAESILLADKLSKLEPNELVMITVNSLMGKLEEPTPAGELLKRLQHFACAYTVNDKSEPVDDEPKVRKVNIDVEVLECIEFKDAPSLLSHFTKLSDFNAIRPMHKIGFSLRVHSGKEYKFSVSGRGNSSKVYAKNYEDRAFAIAALALLGVADKHQYYGELQVVSDTLDKDFVDEVNGILRGRDFYETLNYLKGFFDVEEVKK